MNTIIKFLGWAAVAVVVIFSVSTLFHEREFEPRTFKSDVKVKLKELMKSEPQVMDYTLTDANVLYVAVFDDGTRRDGYAEYFCQVIHGERLNIQRVKIVKAGSMKDSRRDNAYGILLGESWCK